jgi:hypothetical protein
MGFPGMGVNHSRLSPPIDWNTKNPTEQYAVLPYRAYWWLVIYYDFGFMKPAESRFSVPLSS